MGTRSTPERRAAALLVALLAACGCASPSAGTEGEADAPLVAIPLDARLRLAVPAGAVARVLLVEVLIAPVAAGEVTVVARRPALARGDDALLDLRVRYEDFAGRGPVSYGQTLSRAIELGEDGVARPDAPLVRRFELHLPPPGDALLRRVTVTGRLWPVDVVGPDGRGGGLAVPLRGAVIESHVPASSASLRALLGAPDATGHDVFLAAIAEAREERARVLDDLVASLPGRGGDVREGVLAALFALTGQPHGRAAYRWAAWWDAVRRGEVEDTPAVPPA